MGSSLMRVKKWVMAVGSILILLIFQGVFGLCKGIWKSFGFFGPRFVYMTPLRVTSRGNPTAAWFQAAVLTGRADRLGTCYSPRLLEFLCDVQPIKVGFF